MLIAFTTTGSKEEAQELARVAIEHSHAVCVQIDGPVTSVYRWQGKIEEAQEFRVAFKCLPDQLAGLEARVLRAHSYETPEWIVVTSEHVGEKYLNWAIETSTPARFS
jgi:periplasmic divalent cation tolerance protein